MAYLPLLGQIKAGRSNSATGIRNQCTGVYRLEQSFTDWKFPNTNQCVSIWLPEWCHTVFLWQSRRKGKREAWRSEQWKEKGLRQRRQSKCNAKTNRTWAVTFVCLLESTGKYQLPSWWQERKKGHGTHTSNSQEYRPKLTQLHYFSRKVETTLGVCVCARCMCTRNYIKSLQDCALDLIPSTPHGRRREQLIQVVLCHSQLHKHKHTYTIYQNVILKNF